MFSQFRRKGLEDRTSRRNTRQARFQVDGLEDRRLMTTSVAVQVVVGPVSAEVVGGSQATTAPRFEVESFSFGISPVIAPLSSQAGLGEGKASFSLFSLTRKIDRTSPELFDASDVGNEFSQITIETTIQKPGGKTVLVDYTFSDVTLDGIQWTGANGDEAPEEEVTFAYKSVSVMMNTPPSPTSPANPGSPWTTVG